VSAFTNRTQDIDNNNDGSATDPVGNTAIGFSSISGNVVLGGKAETTTESDEDPNLNQPDNQSNLTIDFGFQPLFVGDKVWFDANVNGIQDVGERGMANVIVRIHDGSGTFIAQTITDANGNYRFSSQDGLVGGNTYEIRMLTSQDSLSAYEITGVGVGTPATDNNGTLSGSYVTSGQFTAPISGFDLNIDFGLVGYSLGNLVFWDNNDDGYLDASEIGIPGVSVMLVNSIGNVVAYTTTDASGKYLFTGLIPGSYQVAVRSSLSSGALNGGTISSSTYTSQDTDKNNDGSATDPVGAANTPPFTSISPSVVLGAKSEPILEHDIDPNDFQPDNMSNLTIDFGFKPPTTAIGNKVFWDKNNDGDFDAGTDEYLENVRVSLFMDTNLDGIVDTRIDSVLTDVNGNYKFEGVGAGMFRVVISGTNFLTGGALSSGTPTTNANSGDTITDDNSEGIQSSLFALLPNLQPTADAGDNASGTFEDDDANYTFDFGFYGFSGGPVPVEIIRFEAEKLNNQDALLSWTTASELNNEGFEVYKSVDGGYSYSQIGFAEGFGNSQSIVDYQFIDENASRDQSTCYKLKQIDFDQKFEWTDGKCISWNREPGVMVVYPNPAMNLVNVQLNERQMETTIELISLDGKVLFNAIVSRNEILTIDLKNYSEGVYFVRATNASESKTERIVISH
jgi:hypothetical protein